MDFSSCAVGLLFFVARGVRHCLIISVMDRFDIVKIKRQEQEWWQVIPNTAAAEV